MLQNILVVEDEDFKLGQIMSFLNNCILDCNIEIAKSVHSAKRKINHNSYDLIVMDMSLPAFDINSDDSGGRPQGFGGRELLGYMDYREYLYPVVVVTQFERFGNGVDQMNIVSLEKQLKIEYKSLFVGLVFFSHISENWKKQLSDILSKVERRKNEDPLG